MPQSVRSIYVWSGYLLVMGVALTLSPNALLSLLGVAETTEVWIRVVGLLAVLLALFYWDAARAGTKNFFVASVLGRVFVALGLVALVIGEAPWQVLVFAAIDVAGAVWTYTALRSE